MRELALITLRIVDENSRLYREEVDGWWAVTGLLSYAEDQMDRIERPNAPKFPGVSETSDSIEPQFRPVQKTALLRLHVCNPDSALGVVADDEEEILKPCFDKLERAGLKLLQDELQHRKELNDMSKLLLGEGVEPVDRIQFYAVFQLVDRGEEINCALEGVLRLDQVGVSIDEAILL